MSAELTVELGERSLRRRPPVGWTTIRAHHQLASRSAVTRAPTLPLDPAGQQGPKAQNRRPLGPRRGPARIATADPAARHRPRALHRKFAQ
jgi:hypothetical protein